MLQNHSLRLVIREATTQTTFEASVCVQTTAWGFTLCIQLCTESEYCDCLELEELETCQAGDVLVVDNALVLHGRLSYQGCRYMATGLTHD